MHYGFYFEKASLPFLRAALLLGDGKLRNHEYTIPRYAYRSSSLWINFNHLWRECITKVESRNVNDANADDPDTEIVLPLRRVFAPTDRCKFNVSYKHLMRLGFLIHELSWKWLNFSFLRSNLSLRREILKHTSSVSEFDGTSSNVYATTYFFFLPKNVVEMRLMFNIREWTAFFCFSLGALTVFRY